MSYGEDCDTLFARMDLVKDSVITDSQTIACVPLELLDARWEGILFKDAELLHNSTKDVVRKTLHFALGATLEIDAPGQTRRPFRFISETKRCRERAGSPRLDSITRMSCSSLVKSPEDTSPFTKSVRSRGVNP